MCFENENLYLSTGQLHTLVPHPKVSWDRTHSPVIQTMCSWASPFFRLKFHIKGDLSALLIPQKNLSPSRKDFLWTQTCFEAFIASKTSPDAYWEINISPSGDWNLYFFHNYRLLWGPEERIHENHFHEKSWNSETQCLSVALDLSPILVNSKKNSFDIGLSVVLQEHGGKLGYFALKHCTELPDFHCRESFIIRV